MNIGISMGLETCQIFGQVSHNLLYWTKKAPDGYMCCWGEIDEKTTYIQARSSLARALEVNGKAHAKLKEKQKWSNEKLHLEKCTKFERDPFHRLGG